VPALTAAPTTTKVTRPKTAHPESSNIVNIVSDSSSHKMLFQSKEIGKISELDEYEEVQEDDGQGDD